MARRLERRERSRTRSPAQERSRVNAPFRRRELAANLEEEVGNLFLRNRLSGTELHSLCMSGHREGVPSVAKLASTAAWGKAPKNIARDFMRHFLRGCDAPKLYNAEIPVWDDVKNCESSATLSFLPIPDTFAYLYSKDENFRDTLSVPASMPELGNTMRAAEAIAGVANAGCLGLHSDGVPYLKNESLEVFSWNTPGHPDMARIPITCIPKKYVCKCGCKGFHKN